MECVCLVENDEVKGLCGLHSRWLRRQVAKEVEETTQRRSEEALKLAACVDDMMGALRCIRSLDTPPENLRTIAEHAIDRLKKRGLFTP